MTLLRAAFESKDEAVVLLTVLCVGCFREVVERSGTRHWSRPMSGDGDCEFCLDEVRRAAL
jgi:hypothetical protein